MEKIIKQLAVLGVAGAMALNLGCDLDVEDPHHLAGFAPDSVDGKTGTATVTGGTGDAAATGSFTITFTSPAYSLTDTGGTMGDDTGTYTYTRQGPNTGLIQKTSIDGDAGNITVIFTSPTTATYSYVSTAGDAATQTGNITIPE